MTSLFKLQVRIVRPLLSYSTRKMSPIAVGNNEGIIQTPLKVTLRLVCPAYLRVKN